MKPISLGLKVLPYWTADLIWKKIVHNSSLFKVPKVGDGLEMTHFCMGEGCEVGVEQQQITSVPFWALLGRESRAEIKNNSYFVSLK